MWWDEVGTWVKWNRRTRVRLTWNQNIGPLLLTKFLKLTVVIWTLKDCLSWLVVELGLRLGWMLPMVLVKRLVMISNGSCEFEWVSECEFEFEWEVSFNLNSWWWWWLVLVFFNILMTWIWCHREVESLGLIWFTFNRFIYLKIDFFNRFKTYSQTQWSGGVTIPTV